MIFTKYLKAAITYEGVTRVESIIYNTASKMGLNEVIIEKDFWVYRVLDYQKYRRLQMCP